MTILLADVIGCLCYTLSLPKCSGCCVMVRGRQKPFRFVCCLYTEYRVPIIYTVTNIFYLKVQQYVSEGANYNYFLILSLHFFVQCTVQFECRSTCLLFTTLCWLVSILLKAYHLWLTLCWLVSIVLKAYHSWLTCCWLVSILLKAYHSWLTLCW